MADSQKRVVICGGGIIGASIAYYLSQRGVAATIVEREGVACAASGKAGGFLAKTWNDSSPVGPLTRLSYQLHAELAEEFGAGAIGYRAVTTLQVVGLEAGAQSAKPRGAKVLPSWVDGNVQMAGELAGPSVTAQVHPRLLTQALVDAAIAGGAQLVKGTVESLEMADDDGRVTGVLVDGSLLPADIAVIAMGPWSGAAAGWLRGKYDGAALDITGTKYHSAVLTADVTAHCLFTSFTYANGQNTEPEVYPRPDGTVYVCGEPQSVPLPQEGPAGVTVDNALVERIMAVAGSLASGLKGAPVEAAQACYLPIPPGGGVPVIGPVPGVPGVLVATGHSCWGILNGPATGKALAELIVDGKVSCLPGGLSSFDPALFQGEL